MRFSGPFQPKLISEQPVWYQPSSGTDVTGRGIGPDWSRAADAATVSHPAPANSFLNQFRRTKIASSAAADEELGVHLPNAEDLSVWRGNAANLGGFHFSARFIVSALPGTSIRFFCGLSAANVGQCLSNNFTAAGVGMWCDTTDAGALSLGTASGAGAPTKSTFTTAHTLQTGILYEFVMFGNPNGGSIVTQLWNVGTETIINDQNVNTTMPGTSTFMGPQIGLSNASAGSGYSLDVISVYVRPNHLLYPGL